MLIWKRTAIEGDNFMTETRGTAGWVAETLAQTVIGVGPVTGEDIQPRFIVPDGRSK